MEDADSVLISQKYRSYPFHGGLDANIQTLCIVAQIELSVLEVFFKCSFVLVVGYLTVGADGQHWNQNVVPGASHRCER